uniref:CBM20 domain-containing protein n=1 Tax=Davidia involucrata TaxID=16924 RepID=A0A5B7B0S6_DAVIN
MEALTGWPTKIFTNDYRDKAMSSSRARLSKPEIHLFPSLNFNLSGSHRISLRHKIQSFAISHHSSITEVLTGLESADTGIQTIQPSKSVHVKFQLQKECLFGEQFLLVGDDPIIGLWNPANAIPLNWSDRHIWSVELDIPIGKLIQFKYILRRTTGDILWQPGPDRIFRAWETQNLITIAEDWGNAEVQKITEDPNENLTVNLEKEPVIDAKVTRLREQFMPNANDDLMSSDNIACPEEKPIVKGNRGFITTENTKEGSSELNIRDSIGYKKGESIGRNKWRAMTDQKPVGTEEEETLFTYEEGSVLIPGMTPTPIQEKTSTDEALPKEIGKFIISEPSARDDAAKDQKVTS